jgi:hypothetical protein
MRQPCVSRSALCSADGSGAAEMWHAGEGRRAGSSLRALPHWRDVWRCHHLLLLLLLLLQQKPSPSVIGKELLYYSVVLTTRFGEWRLRSGTGPSKHCTHCTYAGYRGKHGNAATRQRMLYISRYVHN